MGYKKTKGQHIESLTRSRALIDIELTSHPVVDTHPGPFVPQVKRLFEPLVIS